MTRRQTLLTLFKTNRVLAHEYLFRHRHKEITPPFHEEMIGLLNCDHPLVALEAFRGGAKSTRAEEDALLKALFKEEEFILIVGNSWSSACERLATIRQELETNDALIDLFGDQKSSPWSADELVLANGVKLQALGARQSMRGVKHNSERPTYGLIDDLEDEESVATEESRRKTERWLNGTFRPALNPKTGKIRFIGTALHPKALIEKKCNDPQWLSRKFPICYIDEQTGQEQATWPDRFPMEWIVATRQDYIGSGNLTEFEQEYMCRAEDEAGKPFQASMIRVAAAPAVYMPIDIIVDPARTIKQRSARTGYAATSWLGNHLYVHEAFGAFHLPDQLINTVFELNARYNPAQIGIESNALEEFIMQPLRAKAIERGISLPLVDLRAPNDKDGFIKGLQPFYKAGAVTHVKHLPDLDQELLQFPTGRKDVPNALAYAPRMRAGRPVYEDFTGEHIAPVLEVHPGSPKWLAVSARPAMVCAALMQHINGVLRVYANWVVDKPPLECLTSIVCEAAMAAEGPLKLIAPLEQFDRYTNQGLPAAFRQHNYVVTRGGYASKAEGILKNFLISRPRGEPAFMVAEEARWTINGLARGYARALGKGGVLADHPTDNQYCVLGEAIEVFAAYVERAGKADDNMTEARYAIASDGRRFMTSLPRR
jgi:hypothetical protein